MKMTGNTIFITGGGTGIGLSMAKLFCEMDNTVIICGRRADRLAKAQAEIPNLHAFVGDVSTADGRNEIFKYIIQNFPNTNMLINNAGLQKDIDLTKGMEDLLKGDCEIITNLEAPIYLSALFTSHLSAQESAAIIHITSGLAFMPERSTLMPVYCATKAALHAFSIAQRNQLDPLGIRVVEIIPPRVESELNTEGRRKRNQLTSPHMMTSDEFAAAALAQMAEGLDEIRILGK